jgi:hypothetical protein
MTDTTPCYNSSERKLIPNSSFRSCCQKSKHPRYLQESTAVTYTLTTFYFLNRNLIIDIGVYHFFKLVHLQFMLTNINVVSTRSWNSPASCPSCFPGLSLPMGNECKKEVFLSRLLGSGSDYDYRHPASHHLRMRTAPEWAASTTAADVPRNRSTR